LGWVQAPVLQGLLFTTYFNITRLIEWCIE